MPLTGNVIDVQKIQLTDTFQTWFAKTNEMVDALNPVNIYDIDDGKGTNVTFGLSGTAYNGIKYVDVITGYGVGVGGGSAKPWTGVVGLDISSISGNAYTLTGNESKTAGSIYTSEVGDNDYFVVLDTSDPAQGLSGTTKVVKAQHMMPRTVFTPETTFKGNIVVDGDLSVRGAGSSIAANTLSVTDKFIYLAITGGAGSTAPASTASILLNAGVVIGISGGTNKEIIWNYNSTNDYITFNTNYGAKSASNALVNSKFIARDFITSGTTANTFIFEAAGSTSTRMWFTESGFNPYFGIVKDTNSSNVNFNVYNGAGITSVAYIIAGATSQYTGVTANAFIRFANVDMVDGANATTGASAWTIPVSDQFGEIYAERHNAGQIKRRFTQASHGLTTGQAVAVIMQGAASGTPGTITGAQANSTSTEAFGIVDRVISANEFSVTMKGYMDLASNGLLGIGRAITGQTYYLDWMVKGGLTTNTNVPSSQLYQPLFVALGASSGIVYGNEADVIFPYAQDQVYMRGMIPIGVIQPYAGGLAGLTMGLSGGSIPVSDIQYNDNWMPCDGRALSATGASGFVDLFNLIGYTYSMRGVVISLPNAADTVIRPDRGTANLGSLGLGLLAGAVRVIKRTTGTDSPNIVKTYSYTGLTADGTTITLKGLTTQNSNIDANVLVDILSPKDGSYFFAPDLRGKAPFGEYAPYGARGEGFSLTAGATGGTATGDGGLFTNYIIRAKREADALILTGHNHDTRYLRKDTDSSADTGTLTLKNLTVQGQISPNVGIGLQPIADSSASAFALSILKNGNFNTVVSVYNQNDDANSSAGYRMNNYIGNAYLTLSRPSSSTLTLSTDSSCSGGIQIYTGGATGPIRFYTNTGVERMRIDPQGVVKFPQGLTYSSLIGSTPAKPTETIGLLNYDRTSGVMTLGSWSSGADALMTFITTKGGTASERMRIDPAGNVGIGTSNPIRKLHIVSASDTPSAIVDDGTISQVFAYPSQGGSVAYSGTLSNHAHALITNNTQRLWITNAGNVGIGTSTPTRTLDVNGSIGIASSGYLVQECPVSAASWARGIMFSDGSGVDVGGLPGLTAAIGLYGQNNNASHLYMGFDGAWSSNIGLYVTRAGNVGIGTYGPNSLMNLQGNSPVLNIENTNGNVNNGGVLRFGHFQETDRRPIAEIRAVLQDGSPANRAGHLAFHTSSSGTLSPRMIILKDGNVGIGTTIPSNILAIQGGTADTPTNLNKTKGIVLEGGMGSPSYSSIGYSSGGGGGAGIHFSRGTGYQTNISFTTNSGSTENSGALTERMKIDSNGDVYILTNTASTATNTGALMVAGGVGIAGILNAAGLNVTTGVTFASTSPSTSTGSGALVVAGGVGIGGSLYIGGGITATAAIYSSGNITAFSDRRLKENITNIESGLSKVVSLNGVQYTDIASQQRRTGLIAQDVLPVLPEAVHMNADGYYALAYGNMIGLLVEGIKELNAKVDSLSAKVEQLSSKGSE